MPDPSPELKTISPKTVLTVPISPRESHVHGLMDHPQRDKMIDQAIAIAQRPRWLRLIGKPFFDAKDLGLDIFPQNRSLQSIPKAAQSAVDQARAESSQCPLSDPITRSDTYLGQGRATEVTFTCEAATCCKQGILIAEQALLDNLDNSREQFEQQVNSSTTPS